jgi:uncharacterized protein
MLFRVALFFLMLVSHNVLAVEVKGLYETEVIAKSQSVADRGQAVNMALRQVLTRVMVSTDIDHDLTVQHILANANDYVREYQYSLTQAVDHKNGQARFVRILFDEQKLQKLLRNSPLGLWNEIRPETLLWLVVEDQGQRQFYSAEKMPILQNALLDGAVQLGLPLLFPLMDMEEQTQLTIAKVLSPDPHPLKKISERYDAVSILVGLLVNQHECWLTEWTLYFDQKVRQWQSECKPLKQAVMVGLQGTYVGLGDYYAVKPDLLQHDQQFAALTLNTRCEICPRGQTATPIKTSHHHN